MKSSEFNGYKFSVLLKVNEDADTNSISYEVIQNKKFKFVIMYITLNLGDYWIDGNVNRKLLYELNHKIVLPSIESSLLHKNTSFTNSNLVLWPKLHSRAILYYQPTSRGATPNSPTSPVGPR